MRGKAADMVLMMQAEEEDDDDEFITFSIKSRMETACRRSHCIFRVPDKLRLESPEAYSPKLVSIGPFHMGDHDSMEDHKWRYLNSVLLRKPHSMDETTRSCVKALKALEGKARSSYAQDLGHIRSHQFVTMLLVDGCFIIELFFRSAIRSSKLRDDPFFDTVEKLSLLRRDLTLLENQLPFFVLQCLFCIVPIPRKCSGQALSELALRFFRILIPRSLQDLQETFHREGHHLLDLVRSCYVPKYPKTAPSISSSGGGSGSEGRQRQLGLTTEAGLDCATKLREMGIRIRSSTGADSVLDVKFANGVLWVPPLKISGHTEVLMRNMVALEECCGRDCACASKFVTSYAWLMNALVQSEADVQLLIRRRVLPEATYGAGGSCREDVSALFDRVCKGVGELEEFYYYEDLCQRVSGYTRPSPWNYISSMLCCAVNRRPTSK